MKKTLIYLVVLVIFLTSLSFIIRGYNNRSINAVPDYSLESKNLPETSNDQYLEIGQCDYPTPQFIEGCEGEACGILMYEKAIKEVDVYKEPSLGSKVIDKLGRCEIIKDFQAHLWIREFGKAKITALNTDKIPNLKLGDLVSIRKYIGEGYLRACWGDLEFQVSEFPIPSIYDPINVEVLFSPKTEAWVKLTTPRNITGYTPDSDFYIGKYTDEEGLLCP